MRDEFSKLSLKDEFFNLALVNDLNEFEKIMPKSELFLKERDEIMNTCIHYCFAFNKNLEIIKYLVERENFDANVENKNGSTPFHFCMAFNSNIEIVKYLIENGFGEPEQENFIRNTAFHLACMKNENLDIIKYLIEQKNCDISWKNSDGLTPFHYAFSTNENLEIMKYLFEKRGVDLSLKIYTDYNIFEYCCLKCKDLKKIKYLFSLKDWCSDSIKESGNTFLHIACYSVYDNLEVIRYFVEKKKINVNLGNKRGDTPLHIALKTRRINRIKYLVEAKSDLNQKNIRGDTPLHVAFNNPEVNEIKYFFGSDLNQGTFKYFTPRNVAFFEVYFYIIKFLVESKCELNRINEDGNTPLHLLFTDAFLRHRVDTVSPIIFFSLSCGASLKISNNLKKTVKDLIIGQSDEFNTLIGMIKKRNIWKPEIYKYLSSSIQNKIFNFLLCLKQCTCLTRSVKPPKVLLHEIISYFVSFTTFSCSRVNNKMAKEQQTIYIKKRQLDEKDRIINDTQQLVTILKKLKENEQN